MHNIKYFFSCLDFVLKTVRAYQGAAAYNETLEMQRADKGLTSYWNTLSEFKDFNSGVNT